MKRVLALALLLGLLPLGRVNAAGISPRGQRELDGTLENFLQFFNIYPRAIPRWQYQKKLGPQTVLVIPVYFQGPGEGTAPDMTIPTITNTFQGGSTTFSISNWFDSNSGGQTTITTTVLTWYLMPQTMAYYGADTVVGTQVYHDVKIDELIQDAITAAGPQVPDFSIYDHVVVLHAGTDQAHNPALPPAAVSNRIWSVCRGNSRFNTSGGGHYDGAAVIATDASPVAFTIPMGTWLHELLHSFGVPDFYSQVIGNQNWGQQAVGPWSVMSNPWLTDPTGTQSVPQSADAVVKQIMGWGPTPTVLSAAGTYSILPTGPSGNTVYRMNIPSSQEFFLLEYREFDRNGVAGIQAGDWDGAIPVAFPTVLPGVIIWHCDQTMIDTAKTSGVFNTSFQPGSGVVPHFAAKVELPGLTRQAANGLGETIDAFIQNQNGPIAATFSQGAGVTAFTPATVPNSNNYANANSGLFVSNISAAPANVFSPMTFSFGQRLFNGFPYTTGASATTASPQIGDITGDGIAEFLQISNNKLWAWNNAGLVATFTLDSAGNPLNIRTAPALVDLDGDGTLEVIVAGYQNVWALRWNGGSGFNVVWQKNYSTAFGTANSSPAVGDVDGDGSPEIFVGNRIGCLYGWHADGSQIAFPSDSNCNLGFAMTTLNDTLTATPTIADIDGSGGKEIIVSSAGSGGPGIYVFNNTGSNYSLNWPLPTVAISSSAAVADLAGTPTAKAIIVGSFAAGSSNFVRAYRPNASVIWNFNLGSLRLRASPAVGDLNGDGTLDVVFGDNGATGNLHALHGTTGAELSGFPYATGGGQFSSAALGDLDGDGFPDIVIGTNAASPLMLALTYKLISSVWTVQPVLGWTTPSAPYPNALDGTCDSSPAIGPVSNNPTFGIFAATKSANGSLYAWDWGNTFTGSTTAFPWTSFHHDRYNSGDFAQDTLSPPYPAPVSILNVGNGTALTIRWTTPTGPLASDIAGYEVVRADNGVPPNVLSTTDVGLRNQVTVGGLSSGTTYNFGLRAYDGAKPKNKSARSPWLTATPTNSGYSSQVAALSTSNPGDGRSLALTWNAAIAPPEDEGKILSAAGYTVEWDTTSNPTDYKNTIDVGNILAFTIAGLTTGTTYYINVVPYDATKNRGARATEVSGVPLNTLPPANPYYPRPRNVGDGVQVDLAWAANTDWDLAGYRLSFGTSPGVYGAPIDVGNVTSYTLGGLTNNTTYYFALKAYDSVALVSGYSAETSLFVTSTPSPPGNVSLQAIGEGCSLSAQWAANQERDLSGYKVSYGTSPGVYTTTVDTGLTAAATLTGLTPGTTYYVAVRAYDTGANLSGFSPEFSAAMIDGLSPAKVTNSGFATKSGTNVALSWPAVTLNANGGSCENVTGYRVYRGTTPNFAPGTPLASPTPPNYSDTGAATPGTDYYYLVSAVDSSGNESLKN